MSRMTELAEEVKAKVEEAKKHQRDALEPLLRALFEEYPDLKQIKIRGWTPGFNDGDPCEHSQDLFVFPKDYLEHDDEEGLCEAFGVEEMPDWKTPEYEALEKIGAGERAIYQALNLFEPTFHELYGTNWEFTLTRDFKELPARKDVEEYWCGY